MQSVDVAGFGPLSGLLTQINAAAKGGNVIQDDLVAKINAIIEKAKDTGITDTDWPGELRTLLQGFDAIPQS